MKIKYCSGVIKRARIKITRKEGGREGGMESSNRERNTMTNK
jgi:hypothetical protein